MIKINTLDQMNHFAEILAKYIEPGDLILLDGNLGAGKTTLSQFIGKHLGVKRTINSPTFNIIKSYKGTKMKFHHMDCYRLEDAEEDLGFEEYFNDHALTVIEWSAFISDFLPKDFLRIMIKAQDETERIISLEANGKRYDKLKEEVERELLAARYIE
ncbi:tRNA (adenosine(37)-N6)-threonylcarbamoyltransferase complex ATPase subunit type 1 TsaE [Staphylococcus condimenti]|uniref:tRNA threonylcarbamoyladenosine biosynthesis protein TsaE n=1 Tax=Staphylococcus condimenti TaxID=70255 RepID=A0A143PFY2_9STAP|nr:MULTISPECIES: tRNA (adenosine(37)-N6)-threonylcarbamoyltransferase complex ATPase subunit type 1 TsaE [Staphylococcus]AMY06684.1 tRNA threonylcarbamoyladenosine biosynthesis protein TsaE [Staphylococcus condimenti]APR60566.1 tRNA (adenosine(37)-N6)-threonylcarbamoyltransferase complex ATPase subunit type 1 TsaE [Staphylococcus condimenti]MDK8645485.1 tRNA (adenosine(37)-N6)-threonylcarbamoyltransferase complex ATPase subunit type 1 TsaE [Staphylococcus condimenti]OFP00471.1 tRNA threonylcarb